MPSASSERAPAPDVGSSGCCGTARAANALAFRLTGLAPSAVLDGVSALLYASATTSDPDQLYTRAEPIVYVTPLQQGPDAPACVYGELPVVGPGGDVGAEPSDRCPPGTVAAEAFLTLWAGASADGSGSATGGASSHVTRATFVEGPGVAGVPEPTTIALVTTGLTGVALVGRRRSRAATA